jgi:hypothetical protein
LAHANRERSVALGVQAVGEQTSKAQAKNSALTFRI